MPILHFKGKPFLKNYHHTVAFHRLVEDAEKSTSDTPSLDDNLIIHGDNLKALKALLPTHAGKVKCIYIDPPYNRGNSSWKYKDNVNSPMIQAWFDHDVDGSDLARHDKWCCMMYPRLIILRELLHEDGILFVSIGDDEAHHLRCMLDEIFGEEFFLAQFTWKSRAKPTNTGNAVFRPQKVAEYVFAYSRQDPEEVRLKIGLHEERRYPYSDSQGNYRTTTILTSNRGTFRRETMRFEIAGFTPDESQRWKAGYDEIKELYDTGRVGFNDDGVPHRKHYDGDEEEMLYPLYTYMDETLTGTAENGKTEVNQILGPDHGFDTVKPVGLIRHFISLLAKDGEQLIVLDSYAGTGTTAQAVLELNMENETKHKFVLVECEDYADDITAERVRRVSRGVPEARDEKLREGLGGTFSYFTLGDPIDVDAMLDGTDLPSFIDLAKYAFHTATGENIDLSKIDPETFYIGSSKTFEVFLVYEPDKEKLKELALNSGRAEEFHERFPNRRKLVFAPCCYLDDWHLSDLNISFAQLPFEIYRIAA